MISRIRVLPRVAIQYVVDMSVNRAFDSSDPWFCISIHTTPPEKVLTDEVRERLSKYQGMRASLSICCGAFEPDSPEHQRAARRYPEIPPFVSTQAHQIYHFVRACQEDPVEAPLVVHCDAGISRSGAVGSWARQYLGLPYPEFKRMNPNIWPNTHITHLLMKCQEEHAGDG